MMIIQRAGFGPPPPIYPVRIAPGQAQFNGEPVTVTFDQPWPGDPPVNVVWRSGRRSGWYPAKPRGWRP